MTNYERFFDDIITLADLAIDRKTGEPMRCKSARCDECLFIDSPEHCYTARQEWARQEYNPAANWDKLPKDTPVLIHCGDDIFKRHFAGVSEKKGVIYVYEYGRSSFTNDGAPLVPIEVQRVELVGEFECKG